MNRKIFLTSAGLPKETRNHFIELLDKKPEDTAIAFVTTAAFPEINKEYIDKDKSYLIDIGINKIDEIDFKGETKDSLLEKLGKYDVIYINGGNTFYLLDQIRESGFDKIIGELLDNGKIYVGVSAGSYVACPTIEMATWRHQDRDRFGLKDLNGLNLVPFLVSVHFEEKYRSIIEEAARTTKYSIIVLNDKQAVVCLDGKYKIVGEGEKIIYNNNDLILE